MKAETIFKIGQKVIFNGSPATIRRQFTSGVVVVDYKNKSGYNRRANIRIELIEMIIEKNS